MDLNRLFFDHQMRLIEAESAPNESLRRLYTVAASALAERIARTQRALGAARPARIQAGCGTVAYRR